MFLVVHPANAFRIDRLGATRRRTPAATAKIAAAAASSRARTRRPPCEPFDSFALPAGSLTVRAKAIALRNNRLVTGVTRPSAQARRKPRTSSAPSLNPMRPARIGTDAPHSRPCLTILNPRLLRCVPNLPSALVAQLVAHERDHMLEGDSGLLEGRRHDHGFATRHRERAVQSRRSVTGHKKSKRIFCVDVPY